MRAFISATLSCSTVEPRTSGGLTKSKLAPGSRPAVTSRVSARRVMRRSPGSVRSLKLENAVDGAALQSPVVPQRMQVREALAEREGGLVQVKLAPEQHRHDGRRGLRRRTGRQHLSQALAVVPVLLSDAFVQAGERLAVRRQHQRI